MHDIVKQHLRTVNAVGYVVIFGIFAATVGLAVVPSYRAGTASIAESRRINAQLDELNGLTPELQAVEDQLQDTRKRLDEAEKRLPSSSAMQDFMKQLNDVSTQTGIQIDSVNPSKDLKDSGGYKSLPVEIIGTGDWETCYHFLIGLRAMSRLTRLDAVSMETVKDAKPSAGSADRPQCRISVNISTFFAR